MNLSGKFNEILKFSFIDTLKIKQVKKMLIYSLIIYFIYFIISILIANSFYFEGMMDPAEYFQLIINYSIIIGIISIPFYLLLVFLEYKIIEGIYLEKKNKSKKINFLRYVKFLLMPLAMFICALFQLFNLKFLLIGITSLLLIVLGFFSIIAFSTNIIAILIGILFIGLGLLIGLAYFFIIIYELIRLILSQAIIVENDDFVKALKTSREKTSGNVINIFIISLIVCFAMMIIGGIFSILPTIYSMLLVNINPLGVVFDPIYNLLLLPTYLLAAYLIVVNASLISIIYLKLKQKEPVVNETIRKEIIKKETKVKRELASKAKGKTTKKNNKKTKTVNKSTKKKTKK
jgi:hypothetical protein